MLKIVTYNLYKGGAADYSAWGRVLNDLDPDILLVQESSAPSKYRDHVAASWCGQVDGSHWRAASNNYWGSGIMVRSGELRSLPLPETLRGWVVGAEATRLPWAPDERPLRIFSIHTPTCKDITYLDMVRQIIIALRPLVADNHVIVGGDFNMTIGLRHEHESRLNKFGEQEILHRLRRELGLVNCWQTLHPNRPLPQTYWHQFQDDSAPHHLDGILVSASLYRYIASCEVLNDAGWIGRSDHVPVVALLAP